MLLKLSLPVWTYNIFGILFLYDIILDCNTPTGYELLYSDGQQSTKGAAIVGVCNVRRPFS